MGDAVHFYAPILGGLILSVSLLVAWWWLVVRGLGQGEPSRAVSVLLIQVSVVLVLFGLVSGSAVSFWIAILPPLVVTVPGVLAPFSEFAWSVLPWAIGAGIVIGLAVAATPLRSAAVAVLLLTGLGTGLWRAEAVSREAICASAEARGLTDLRRNSVLWSLRNAPREFQFELHAAALGPEGMVAWSYREMDWYAVPFGVAPEFWVKSGPPVC